MPIDPLMKKAITDAVQDAGQSKQLSTKLIAWVNALLSGNENLANDEEALRHLELIYEEVVIGEDQ